MPKTQPLLSICIPTYNRANFLDKCLQQLSSQITSHLKDYIELFISNNASTDNTADVVKKYQNQGFEIKLNTNKENIGPDANVGLCFNEGNGKYVWILCDDDFLMLGFLQKIVDILQKNDVGVLFLNSHWYKNENEIPVINPNDMVFTNYKNELDFFRKVNYWITFASGNIINKFCLKEQDWEKQNQGTNLVQMGWVLPAIFSGKNNIYINTPVLACKADNSGGYNLVQVFSKNFNKILDESIAKNIIPFECKNIIQINLLTVFYPNLLRPGFRKSYFQHIISLFLLYPFTLKFYWNCLLLPILKTIKSKSNQFNNEETI